MNTRLIVACIVIAYALCGCAADAPRKTGLLSGKAYQEDIGKPIFPLLSTPDCEVR